MLLIQGRLLICSQKCIRLFQIIFRTHFKLLQIPTKIYLFWESILEQIDNCQIWGIPSVGCPFGKSTQIIKKRCYVKMELRPVATYHLQNILDKILRAIKVDESCYNAWSIQRIHFHYVNLHCLTKYIIQKFETNKRIHFHYVILHCLAKYIINSEIWN